MGFINELLGYPLGWVMWLIYKAIPYYGIALLVFTIFTRLLMLPSTIKQQKSSAKMIKFKPKLDALQKKYGNNREKYQEEMMKLYQEEGYNPMSGCAPMLLQFPILFGLIDVVYKPLYHIARVPKDVLESIKTVVSSNFAEFGFKSAAEVGSTYQIKVIDYLSKHADGGLLAEFGNDVLDKVRSIDLNFLGINLGEVPTMALNVLILVPIISGLTSLLISFVSMRNVKNQSPEQQQAAGMTKGMMFMMPVLSVVISFSVPAGVGIYWIYSNVISVLQTLLLNKYLNPQKLAAEEMALEEQKREEERQARIEAKRLAKEKGEVEEKALSQKEINKRKLAEARRRDAEKYGEEYVEVTDNDFK